MTEADPEPASAPGLASGSLSVATWTGFSRFTGFIRLAVVGAVLGPTYLTNTFQALIQFPLLVYAALTGSVFTMLLVPPVAWHRHVDGHDALPHSIGDQRARMTQRSIVSAGEQRRY